MLYWCGFSTIWKLDIALLIGIAMTLTHQRKSFFSCSYSFYWFLFYMTSLLLISYLGTFGGIGALQFPLDIAVILPFSTLILYFSQYSLGNNENIKTSIIECNY